MNDYLNENIIVSFGKFPFCFNTINTKKYVNALKNDNEFHENFKLLIYNLITYFQNHSLNYYLANNERHTHIIKDSEKMELIKNNIKELMKTCNLKDLDFEQFYDNNISSESVWQLGTSHGLRLICVQQKNIFHVLFIDYYHKIYPSDHYNQVDLSKNEFCPINNYGDD